MLDLLGVVSGDQLPAGRFGWRRLQSGGVMLGCFRLVLGQTGDGLAMQNILRTGAYFLTFVCDAL